MDPIDVFPPPSSAYNPNRRASDLIVGQLKHFQHLEQKHDHLNIDPAVSRDIHTEAGAARYIAAITRALRGQPAAKPKKLAVMPAAKRPKKLSPAIVRHPRAIAAVATPAAPSKSTPKKSAKKSAAKKPSTRKPAAKKTATPALRRRLR